MSQLDGGIFDLILQQVPLWAAALLIVGACLGMRETGTWLFGKVGADSDAFSSNTSDYIVGAIFGLLAFMMGFTFSIAMDRFDARRGLVVDEASALRATYFTASLLDEPYSSNVRGAVRDYAQTRIVPTGLWSSEHDPALEKSRMLRERLWSTVRAGVMPIRETDLGTYLAETSNEAVNLGERRELVGRSHIPTRILDLLLLYTLVASGVLGFLISKERRGVRKASSLLLILYCASFALIIDLDRPQAGGVRVPQTALEDLNGELGRDAQHVAASDPKELP